VASTEHGELGIDQSPSPSILLLLLAPLPPFELTEVQRHPPPPVYGDQGQSYIVPLPRQVPCQVPPLTASRYNTTLWTAKLFPLVGPCRPGSPSYSAVLYFPGDPSLKVPSPQYNLSTLAHHHWRAMSIYNYLPPSCFSSIWAAREQVKSSTVLSL